MAVLLLQNGIDTNIKNHRGQLGIVELNLLFLKILIYKTINELTTAIDLARDAQTLQVLSVKSVRKVNFRFLQIQGHSFIKIRYNRFIKQWYDWRDLC